MQGHPSESTQTASGVHDPIELTLELPMLLTDSSDVLEANRLEVQARTDALDLVDRRRAAEEERHHPGLVRLRRVLLNGQEPAEVGGSEVVITVIVPPGIQPLLYGALRVDRDLERALLDRRDGARAAVQTGEELRHGLGIVGPFLDDFDGQVRRHVLHQFAAEPEQLRTGCALTFEHDISLATFWYGFQTDRRLT